MLHPVVVSEGATFEPETPWPPVAQLQVKNKVSNAKVGSRPRLFARQQGTAGEINRTAIRHSQGSPEVLVIARDPCQASLKCPKYIPARAAPSAAHLYLAKSSSTAAVVAAVRGRPVAAALERAGAARAARTGFQ
eukprot:2769210-Pleurochrysis_carterae.AAC.2